MCSGGLAPLWLGSVALGGWGKRLGGGYGALRVHGILRDEQEGGLSPKTETLEDAGRILEGEDRTFEEPHSGSGG